jgi:hypothetical protein
MMNGYANTNCFKNIQKRVNRFVGVPITWLVYLTWQVICWLSVKVGQTQGELTKSCLNYCGGVA